MANRRKPAARKPPARSSPKPPTSTPAERELEAVAADVLTEAEAAEMLGWTEARLKMRRVRAHKHPGEDYVPVHAMLAKRPRYLRSEVLRWIEAHPEMFGDERMLELEEVSETLGVPLRSLRAWRMKQRKDPKLDLHPAWVSIGPKVYVPLRELEAWLQRRLSKHRERPWETADVAGGKSKDPAAPARARAGERAKPAKRRR